MASAAFMPSGAVGRTPLHEGKPMLRFANVDEDYARQPAPNTRRNDQANLRLGKEWSAQAKSRQIGTSAIEDFSSLAFIVASIVCTQRGC
jgi:hypothetical protein